MAEEPIDITGLIASYVTRLRDAGIDPQEVILYGSHARGEAGPDSDIDLVVISSDLARWPALERLELLSRLTAGLGAPLEVLGYTPDEVRDRGNGSILWAEIVRDGRQVLAA
jgi:predicted nucleotidyltransferase